MKKSDTPYFELDKKQTRELINLAKFTKKDIFYDLGSGTGKVVLEVVEHSPVKMAIGIENMKRLHEKARERLTHQYSLRNSKRVDFWLGHLDNDDEDNEGNLTLDYSNATVIFYSLDEDEEFVICYKNRLQWNKTRIIKKDIPIIGYDSIANRTDKGCWLFLSKPPHKRIRSKQKWIKTVSPDFQTLDDVYNYYYNQLTRRFEKLYREDGKSKAYSKIMGKKDATSSLLQLKMVVNARF